MGWSPFRSTGLTHHHAAQSVKGYTLITPIRGDGAYLIDMDGRVVHRWRLAGLRSWYGRLLENGRLLIGAIDASLPPPPHTPFDQPPPPVDEHIRRLGGWFTHLLELDWDSSVKWEYRNERMHHDFVRLPDGNTVVNLWVELPPELVSRVRGGVRRPREKFPPMLSDDYVEIDAGGREVARVSPWKGLDPRRDAIGPTSTRWEWTHTNSLWLTRAGQLLFSCRTPSMIGMIDRTSGAITWKWGAGELGGQHHATELPNGNVLLFDNGYNIVGLQRSRVLEVNPKDGAIAWQYTADPAISFFSPHISGADDLGDGNVLVCEGGSGRVFEITRRGEIVWEWINPFVQRAPQPAVLGGGMQASVAVFRAHRYRPDFPGLAGRRLDPAAHADLNRMYGLDR